MAKRVCFESFDDGSVIDGCDLDELVDGLRARHDKAVELLRHCANWYCGEIDGKDAREVVTAFLLEECL